MKTDIYNKVTDQIVASLEQGVRPWMKPWSAEHAVGRITRPLRANGIPYQEIPFWNLLAAVYPAPLIVLQILANSQATGGESDRHYCAALATALLLCFGDFE